MARRPGDPAPPPRAPFDPAPYAAGVRPFSIGLAPCDPALWLGPDALLADELALKERILSGTAGDAAMAEPGSEAGQAEAAEAVLAHLAGRFPAVWRVDGETASVGTDGFRRTFRREAFRDRPLELAARLVQDDLVLMRRGASGWRLAAAALCFPSSWSLAEKFGRDMGEIHASVPGYPGRMAGRVERILDNLKPGAPVERFNWSIYPDGALRHAGTKAAADYRRARGGRSAADLFVRTERQTLVRLPASGDVLFTIRVAADPVAALGRHPDGPALAAALARGIAALDRDQLAYKGLLQARDRLVADLSALAGGAGT